MIRNILVIAFAVVVMICGYSYAAKEGGSEKRMTNSEVIISKEQQEVLDRSMPYLDISKNYSLVGVSEGVQNKDKVFIYRYGKAGTAPLGGEHYSVVLTQEGQRILGFTFMDEKFEKGQTLPNREETREIAKAFLEKTSPGLFEKLDNRWIEPHDEVIEVAGKSVTIRGMKFKCYSPSTKDYTWVIIGATGEVITFETGIIWTLGRDTEKWLHDSWLEKK